MGTSQSSRPKNNRDLPRGHTKSRRKRKRSDVAIPVQDQSFDFKQKVLNRFLLFRSIPWKTFLEFDSNKVLSLFSTRFGRYFYQPCEHMFFIFHLLSSIVIITDSRFETLRESFMLRNEFWRESI